MTMETVITEQSAENMTYVLRLLRQKQPGFAALLAPWFARRTVADLTAALAGTSVPWARLHNLSDRA
jgi:crotonobetainyl-CoA:carnitine CoA-transferase CaiB-like acyl-CoA transferase